MQPSDQIQRGRRRITQAPFNYISPMPYIYPTDQMHTSVCPDIVTLATAL
jgi:hypothetical protein